MSDDFFSAYDNRHTAAPALTDSFTASTRDLSAYAAKALEGELANVRAAPPGSRNHELNKAALKLGHLIASGVLEHAHVRAELGRADTRPGDSGKVAWATIDSGLGAGMQQARLIPDRPVYQNASEDIPPWIETSSRARSADSLDTDTPGDPTTATNTTASDADNARRTFVLDRLPAVDWHKAWQAPEAIEWIIEPIWPARRGVALYSAPKVGKSLLMLELAYGVCRGEDVLGYTPAKAYRVLYVDFENDLHGDIVPRLRNMGAEPQHLDNLQYLSLPTLAGLDSERGAQELIAAVDEYGCEAVIIDTLSRSVDGDENENDTWLKFYRHTGLKLKQRGVSMIRLDHSGKDETKGQRGGSAKGGDIDAVWRMQRLTDGTDGQPETFRLICEMNRFPVAEKLLTLVRHESPLRHTVKAAGARDIIAEAIVRYLDANEVPLTAGRDGLLAGVKVSVPGASQNLLDAAIKLRRDRASV